MTGPPLPIGPRSCNRPDCEQEPIKTTGYTYCNDHAQPGHSLEEADPDPYITPLSERDLSDDPHRTIGDTVLRKCLKCGDLVNPDADLSAERDNTIRIYCPSCDSIAKLRPLSMNGTPS